MSDYNETVPITAEARGLARALHNRVIASDLAYDKARQLIFKPLYERLRRKPTVRSEMALEICGHSVLSTHHSDWETCTRNHEAKVTCSSEIF